MYIHVQYMYGTVHVHVWCNCRYSGHSVCKAATYMYMYSGHL